MSKTIGLRTEILMILALLLGATLLLGGMLILRVTEKNLLEQRLVQLQAIAQTLSVDLTEQLLGLQRGNAGDTFLTFTQLNQLSHEVGVSSWSVFDWNLNLLSEFQKEGVEPFVPVSLRKVRFTDEISLKLSFPSLLEIFGQSKAEVRLVVPLRGQQRFLGVLGLVVSLEDVQERLAGIRQMVLLYVLLYGLVLISVGFVLLQRNLISPARRLLTATRQVANGDLSVKLPVSGPREIMQLADSFNRMTDAVLKSQQEAEQNFQKVEAANRELQQARDELIRSEKIASMGQLAAGLAHELGNPLGALTGYLDILKSRTLPEAEQDIVGRSVNEAQRIDQLVREMLEFSRPSKNLPEKINLSETLAEIALLLNNQGLFSGSRFTQEIPSDLPDVYIGKHRLQQVLINLLTNAVQACPQDKGVVELLAGSSQKMAWISIKDNGSGIDSQTQLKIFDPFFTTKEPGEGTGLGLAICQRIIDETSGLIQVRSTPGEGSCFTVNLPIYQQQSAIISNQVA